MDNSARLRRLLQNLPMLAAGTLPHASPGSAGLKVCPKLPPIAWLVVTTFMGPLAWMHIPRLSKSCAALLKDDAAWKAAVVRWITTGMELRYEHSWELTFVKISGGPASRVMRWHHRRILLRIAREAWSTISSVLSELPPGGGLTRVSWAPPFSSADAPLRQVNKPAWFRVVGGLGPFFGKWQHKAWRAGALQRRYRDRKFTVVLPGQGRGFKMRLGSFFHYLQAHHDFAPPHWDAEPLYVFDPKPPLSLRALLQEPPLSSALDLTRACPEFQEAVQAATRGWFLIGGVGSGSRFHKDAYGCGAWSACIQGRKRWALYPLECGVPPGVTCPSTGRYAAPCPVFWFTEILPVLEPSQRPVVDVVVTAGDIMYIPPGWWHCVLNLSTPTIAFTRNVAYGVETAQAAAQALDAAGKRFAAEALRRFAWQCHMDT